MISLTITIDNINDVTAIFNTVQLRKWTRSGIPDTPVTDTIAGDEYAVISGGIDTITNRSGISDVSISPDYSQYYFTDPDGYADDWYISRYYSSSTGSTSGWSDPIQGNPGDLYYNPQFPPEIAYGTADQLVIDRIRLWTGDPLGLRREYGEEALSSIHTDGKTYEMDETGWPSYVNMGGHRYDTTDDPSVNGYRFLRFKDYIDDICHSCTTFTGTCGDEVIKVLKEVVNGIDIWYYTFRHSDRQIMEAYDNCPPPTPLTSETANPEVYMLQTSIDLLRMELWEDATEDGSAIKDEGSTYNPEPGLRTRKDLLDDLTKRRDDLVKSLQLTGVTGVLID